MPIVTRAFSAADSRTVLGRAKAGDVILLEVIEATGDNHSTLRKIINSPYTHCMIALGNGEFAQVPIPQGNNTFRKELHSPFITTEDIDLLIPVRGIGPSVGGLRYRQVELIETNLSAAKRTIVTDNARRLAEISEFSAPNVIQYARKWIEQHRTNPQVVDWTPYEQVVNGNEANRGQNPTKSGMTCFGLIVSCFDFIDWSRLVPKGFKIEDYITSRDIQTAFKVPLTENAKVPMTSRSGQGLRRAVPPKATGPGTSTRAKPAKPAKR
jgi:hypothetical protein